MILGNQKRKTMRCTICLLFTLRSAYHQLLSFNSVCMPVSAASLPPDIINYIARFFAEAMQLFRHSKRVRLCAAESATSGPLRSYARHGHRCVNKKISRTSGNARVRIYSSFCSLSPTPVAVLYGIYASSPQRGRMVHTLHGFTCSACRHCQRAYMAFVEIMSQLHFPKSDGSPWN